MQRYRILREVGRGGEGVVSLVERQAAPTFDPDANAVVNLSGSNRSAGSAGSSGSSAHTRETTVSLGESMDSRELKAKAVLRKRIGKVGRLGSGKMRRRRETHLDRDSAPPLTDNGKALGRADSAPPLTDNAKGPDTIMIVVKSYKMALTTRIATSATVQEAQTALAKRFPEEADSYRLFAVRDDGLAMLELDAKIGESCNWRDGTKLRFKKATREKSDNPHLSRKGKAYGSKRGIRTYRKNLNELETTSARVKSFTGWPHESPSCHEVAQAGFYSAQKEGQPDRCKCFCCGVVCGSWSTDDDPKAEHKRLRSVCSFVQADFDSSILARDVLSVADTSGGNDRGHMADSSSSPGSSSAAGSQFHSDSGLGQGDAFSDGAAGLAESQDLSRAGLAESQDLNSTPGADYQEIASFSLAHSADEPTKTAITATGLAHSADEPFRNDPSTESSSRPRPTKSNSDLQLYQLRPHDGTGSIGTEERQAASTNSTLSNQSVSTASSGQVSHGNGEVFVLKQKYCETLDDANRGLQEAITMVRCLSNNVVAFEDVFLDPRQEADFSFFYLCIVMEFCNGGDLAEWIVDHKEIVTDKGGSALPEVSDTNRDVLLGEPLKPRPSLFSKTELEFDTMLRLRFARHMLTGVADVHETELVHRDIKPENVFLNLTEDSEGLESYTCLLGDFGLAVQSRKDETHDNAGTFYYMAPEVSDRRVATEYNAKADIWSLGCVFIELVTGELLRESPAAKCIEMGDQWDPAVYFDSFSITERLSMPFRDIVVPMLRRDPADRPAAEALLQSPVLIGQELQVSEADRNIYGDIPAHAAADVGGELVRRQLHRRDLVDATEILAQSFIEDPRWSMDIPEEDKRQFGKEILFPTATRFFEKNGAVWGLFAGAPAQLCGVALWLSPDAKKKPPLLRVVKTMARAVTKYPRTVIFNVKSSVQLMQRCTERLRKETGQEPQWLLHTLAIAPKWRGKGLGGELLAPVLQWADHSDTPATTFVASPRTKDFFVRHGFVVIATLEPGPDKVKEKVWLLRRPTPSELQA